MTHDIPEIQKLIRNYLRKPGPVCSGLSQHTMLCFVGMLETGEATYEDFDSCMVGLCSKVIAYKAKLDAERKDQE